MQKVKDKISDTNKVMILFELTMSYNQAIVDLPRRHMMKQLFNDFNKEGQKLWKYSIRNQREKKQEETMDNYIYQLNEVFTQWLNASDPVTLIALMKSFNEGEVDILNDF